MNIFKHDAYNWDVILHEYGHHIANELKLQAPASEGNKHKAFENLISSLGKAKGIRKAWSEGLATYLGTAAPKVFSKDFAQQKEYTNGDSQASLLPAIVGDTSYTFPYKLKKGDPPRNAVDIENSYISPLSKLEQPQTFPGSGEGDEISIARILWDLAMIRKTYIVTGLSDEINLGHKGLFKELLNAKSHQTILPPIIADFPDNAFTRGLISEGLTSLDNLWDYFEYQYKSKEPKKLAQIGASFEEYGVSPSPISNWLDKNIQASQSPIITKNSALPTFQWKAGNYYFNPSTNEATFNNEFQIHVYDFLTTSPILSSPLLNDGNEGEGSIWKFKQLQNNGTWLGEWTPQPETPQKTQWQNIVSNPGKYYVVVTGSDNDKEVNTGAYWSGAHSFTVIDSGNSPPQNPTPKPIPENPTPKPIPRSNFRANRANRANRPDC